MPKKKTGLFDNEALIKLEERYRILVQSQGVKRLSLGRISFNMTDMRANCLPRSSNNHSLVSPCDLNNILDISIRNSNPINLVIPQNKPKPTRKTKNRQLEISQLQFSSENLKDLKFIEQQKADLVYLKTLAETLLGKKIMEKCYQESENES